MTVPQPMDEASQVPIFSVGEESVVWEDLVLAARLWGLWAALERSTRFGLAALDHMADLGEPLPDDEIDRVAEEFRYERDLISGQDAEVWLEARGLDAGDWMGYIRRTVLRTRFAPQAAALTARYPAIDDELEPALRADLICSGEAYRLAWRLAESAAAAAEHAAAEVGPEPAMPDAAVAAAAAVAGGPGLREVDADWCRERLSRIARWERAKKGLLTRVTDPKAIRHEFTARHLDWIRIDGRALSFPSEAMAREAALCVREDGLAFDDVAADAGMAVQEVRFYLEEFEDRYRQDCIAARPLDLLGPIMMDDSYLLLRVMDKVMPSEEDPELRSRAHQRVTARTLEQAIQKHVRWLVRW